MCASHHGGRLNRRPPRVGGAGWGLLLDQRHGARADRQAGDLCVLALEEVLLGLAGGDGVAVAAGLVGDGAVEEDAGEDEDAAVGQQGPRPLAEQGDFRGRDGRKRWRDGPMPALRNASRASF